MRIIVIVQKKVRDENLEEIVDPVNVGNSLVQNNTGKDHHHPHSFGGAVSFSLIRPLFVSKTASIHLATVNLQPRA